MLIKWSYRSPQWFSYFYHIVQSYLNTCHFGVIFEGVNYQQRAQEAGRPYKKDKKIGENWEGTHKMAMLLQNEQYIHHYIVYMEGADSIFMKSWS